jgi:hypothetical protein
VCLVHHVPAGDEGPDHSLCQLSCCMRLHVRSPVFAWVGWSGMRINTEKEKKNIPHAFTPGLFLSSSSIFSSLPCFSAYGLSLTYMCVALVHHVSSGDKCSDHGSHLKLL